MKNEFIENLREVFELDEIKSNDNFRDYDTWDSLTNISLIAMLDDEYDVIIDTNDFKKILTISQLFEEIENRTS